ncbi:hypothetical protein PHMEG_00039730 [Phytophthora megakarya]|uniref:Ankyrin repeat-containing domain n=1 Tax=Phytophthora megakarya TaxID=4795 RepID=A0A225UEZ1_9STRA|nr:hypothetical protein PHMEG_00039730 [Phytophthora megakarya]
MKYAAKGGHLDVVMWLHEYSNKGFTYNAPLWAACNGHLRVLQQLYAYNSESFTPFISYDKSNCKLITSDSIGDIGARNGDLVEIVQWLHENNCGGFTTMAMDSAAQHDHLDVVLYLLENRSEGFSHEALKRTKDMKVLCAQGNLLQSMFKARPSFVRRCLSCLAEIALRTSNIEILDWVNQFGLELRSAVPVRAAVCRGHVTLLQWFCRNGFEVSDPDLLKLAVENGHLDTARWLSKRGYEINSLDLVEMARRNDDIGCVDRVQVVLDALKSDKRRVLWWILTRTRFEDGASRQIIRDGIHGASINTLQWIQDNLMEFEECSWCFTTDESTTVTTETRAAKKLKPSLSSL